MSTALSNGLKCAALVSTAFLLLACGKSHSSSNPPAPCSTGIDQTSCSLDIKTHSIWVRNYEVTSQPSTTAAAGATTAAVGPKVIEKNVSIVTEFFAADDWSPKPTFKRTTIVKNKYGSSQEMWITGEVAEIQADHIRLNFKQSSCDGIDKGIYVDKDSSRPLYYQRYGNGLTFKTRPFQTVTMQKASNPIDAISNAIVGAMATMVTEMTLDVFDALSDVSLQMLTFGRLRDQLVAGSGDFTGTTIDKLTADGKLSDQIQVGCFTGVGANSAFVAAK